VDDVLILANGEKVVPGPTEGALLAHPFVHGAVMFGRERNQVGILLEPTESHAFDPTDESALAAFRNAVWATVSQANAAAPAFGRVYKEMILVTNPNKPLPRAAKGTINRKAAIKAYEQEIDAMYILFIDLIRDQYAYAWTDMKPSSALRRALQFLRLTVGPLKKCCNG
jgi:long-subunit acyl-CoA synthetase (AMP-forming)